MKIALRKSGLRPLLLPVVSLTWRRKRWQVSGTITSQKTSIEAGESTTLRHLVFACGSRLPEEADSLKNLEASSCEEAVGIGDILWMNSDNEVQINANAHLDVQPSQPPGGRRLASARSPGSGNCHAVAAQGGQ